MKAIPAIGLSAVFFTGGLFVGQKFLPSDDSPAQQVDGGISERQTLRRSSGGGSGEYGSAGASSAAKSAAATGDIESLLSLVDPSDSFTTSLQLQEALGPMPSGDLIQLLNGLTEEDFQKNPGFHLARQSVFNHLVMADPFVAFDLASNHPEKNFQQAFMGIALRGVARKDLGQARALLKEIKNPQIKNPAFNMIAQVAMGSDPGAMSELLAETEEKAISPFYQPYWNSGFSSHATPYFHSAYSQNQLLTQWVSKDPEAAEAYVRGIDDKQKRDTAMSSLIAGIAQSDPDRALTLARSLENANSRSQAMSSAILHLSGKDPTRAVELLDEISNVQTRSNMIGSLTNSWMQKDKTAALAWLDSLPPSQGRSQGYSAAISQLASENPTEAAALFSKLPTRARRNSVYQLTSQWAAQDFDAARDWALNLEDPSARANATNQILQTWVSKNPSEAAAYLIDPETPHNNQLNHTATQVASQWARNDPNAAEAWVEGLENKDMRQNAISGLYSQWVSSDPATATARMKNLTDPEDRNSALHAIAGGWAVRDPEATIRWLDTLPTKDHFTATASVLSSLSYSAPERAALLFGQMANDSAGNQEFQNQIRNQAGNISSYWAQYDPQGAAEWATELSEEAGRVDAVRNVASNWVNTDLVGAANWIDTLPEGDSRDSATSSLVNQVREADPASAFDWADSISKDSTRISQIQSVIHTWKTQDPDAARAAVNNANITDQQRENLLKGIE